MSAKYRIGYYQVNIGIGDCEIVLLIKQTSTPKTEEIVKAVLIDGGDINVGENLRLNNVKLLIQTLAKDFNEPSGLKFDVIIITHWDLDHYKGVLELLFDDLLEREKKDITLPPRTPKTTRGRRVGIDRPGAVPYQVSFLKYDSSGNPQSMLYIPFERTRAAPYDVQYSPDPDGVFGFWASQFSRVCNFTADSAPPLPTGDPRTKPPEPIKPTDDSKIIGRELFSGTLHPDAQKAGNPATLVDLYKTGMPGLFCIMANNRYLKPDDDLTLDSKYDTTTLDNRSSIGCLIIWPGGAISHYFAGDMDAQQEEKIISWTGLSPEPTPATNPPPRPDVKNTVPIVKASHHGSSQSLPLRLCQCFKPSVILFSAGKAHNHPAWDRLFLMHAYIVNWAGAHTKTNADGTPRAPPVYLTAYPSYLYKSDLKIANATDYLRDGGKNGDYYRKIYGTFFEKFGDPTLNMVELFKSIDPAPDLSEWVQKELRMKILPTTTSIGDSAYPHNIDSGYVRDKLVSYIKVMYDDTGLQASSEYWEAHPHSNILVKRLAPATVLGPSAPKKKKVNLIDISNATGTGAEDDIDEDDGDEDDGDEDYGDGDDNTTFFLTSSVVEVSDDASRSAFVTDAWDAFVSMLSTGFIALSQDLTAENELICLDDSDEWLSWSKVALSSTSVKTAAVQIFVSAALEDGQAMDGDQAKIDHFEIVVPLPTATSDKGSSLKFGPSYIVGPGADKTFDPLKHFLRFDMTEDTSFDITLKDLLSFSDLPSDLVAFGSDLTFTLVKDKCAIWFSPGIGNYSAALRLQAVASASDWDDTLAALKEFDLWPSDLRPTTIRVIVKTTMRKERGSDGPQCVKSPELGFMLEFTDFSAVIFCGPQAYTFALRWTSGAIDAVRRLLEMSSLNSPGLFKIFDDMLKEVAKAFDILQASVEFKRKGSSFELSKLSVTAQVTLNPKYGQSKVRKEVAFLLGFTWPQKCFSGSLYTADHQKWRELMPYYEELFEVVPTIAPSTDLSILDFIPGISITPPVGIPTIISRAELVVDGTSITFSGALKSYQPKNSDVPAISFDQLDLVTAYDWKLKSFTFSISTLVNLRPHDKENSEPMYDGAPGFLYGFLSYYNGRWELVAQLSDLNFGDLVTFFQDNEQSQVKDILGHITINSLSLLYEYDGKGEPSKFLFTGSVAIAMFGLNLMYSRDGDGWQIKAALGTSKECKLGDVIASICGGDEEASQLPDFISDIPLNIPQSNDPGAWENSPLYLSCSKLTSPAPGPKQGASTPLVFALRITLGKLRFTFIQISYPKSPDVPARKPKRVLMFSFTEILPPLPIPVVGKVENPIDGLQFLWVQDANASSGLTREEIEEINTAAFPGGNELYFKETKKVAGPSDVVIGAGCHFILLVNSGGAVKAGIDYKFATKKKPPPGKMKESEAKEEEVPPGGVSKASVHKKVGPLSIANIGLQFKGGKLFIILDATVALGPIAISLLGFGVGVELTADFFTHFSTSYLGLELRGLGAALDKPPLLLAGVFEDLSAEGSELYGGGVAISVKQYSFLAVGSYGVIADGSGKSYKTFFVFAQLHGPLVELEFATLNGIKLGFGYNSHLRYPNVEEIFTFPLVKGISSGTASKVSDSSNVLTVLADAIFNTWVTPQEGSLWFAAGFDVLAFETLDLRAVAVIEIDPYVSIGLFADAICSLPPNQPREQCFAYTELGIACQIDFKTGTFSIARQLSPNSFVLHPSCHLRGGFALFYWFDPSPYAGQFVFTIGGYHPSFNVPSYYPRSPRLSISWQLDNMISITGEAYFAVTPKCCMGGGMLSVKYNLKLIEAHLDAHADFLIAWNPFHFIADIGVTVGVTLHAKIGPFGGDLTADVGADLHLEGPPFGGKVHVKAAFVSFDIYFGSRPPPPPPLTLNEYWDLLSRSTNQQNATRDVGVTLVVESGYLPDQNKDVTPEPGTPWIVLAGQFKFSIQCRFAVTSVQFQDEDGTHNVLQGKDVYAKPMHLTSPASSELSMSIRKRETSKLVERFTFGKILKNVPSAQWGKYVQGEDPVVNQRPSTLLNGSNSTINDMLMGARVVAPEPEYPDDHIPPYDVNDWMFVDVIEGARLPVEKPSGEAQSWLPKTTTWEGAEKAWMSPPTKPQSTVDAWAKAFGWKDKLVGAAPAILLKNFSRVYLDIPSLTSK